MLLQWDTYTYDTQAARHLARRLLHSDAQRAQRCGGDMQFPMPCQRHNSGGSSCHLIARISISAADSSIGFALLGMVWYDRTAAGWLQAAVQSIRLDCPKARHDRKDMLSSTLPARLLNQGEETPMIFGGDTIGIRRTSPLCINQK